ncbi:testis-expressed protein 33 isoform X1 [Apteryx rowi]|uniref:testis-expressed protein 33 isoform X1 n=1 Tax=Apteryx rowi TaxID=308060 RepID=UPI000E1CEFDC|nr:testis-expressed protein 33 isoform X1 [Apteryx rowi]
MNQEVPLALTPPTPDLAKSDSVLAGSSSVEPGEGRKEHLPASSRPSSRRTSLWSSSRTSWKISKGSSAQGMAKNSTSVKSQAFPSAKCVQNKSHRKQNLQAKTPSMRDLHSRRLEEEGGDTSATKDLAVGHELRGRNSSFRPSALSRQKEAEDKPSSNAKEPAAGQHRTLGSRVPGSPQKTAKASYKEAKETHCRLSAKESLASLGQDVKAEGKLLLEKRNALIHANGKYKSVSADELASSEEERQALCKAGLIIGQKRLSDRTEMLQNPLTSGSFADYYQLGFNLRSNIFQGEGMHIPMPYLQSWAHLHWAWALSICTGLGRGLMVGIPHLPFLPLPSMALLSQAVVLEEMKVTASLSTYSIPLFSLFHSFLSRWEK